MRLDFLKLPQIDMEAINDTIRTSHICGETIWIIGLWKQHWAEVASGTTHLNPSIVFNRKTVLGEYVN